MSAQAPSLPTLTPRSPPNPNTNKSPRSPRVLSTLATGPTQDLNTLMQQQTGEMESAERNYEKYKEDQERESRLHSLGGGDHAVDAHLPRRKSEEGGAGAAETKAEEEQADKKSPLQVEKPEPDTGVFDLKSRARISQLAPFSVEVTKGEKYYWCTCGRSKTQPFCDGSHEDVNYQQGTQFEPLEWEAPETKTYYFCGCKQTNNAPFCDGSHTKFGPTALINREKNRVAHLQETNQVGSCEQNQRWQSVGMHWMAKYTKGFTGVLPEDLFTPYGRICLRFGARNPLHPQPKEWILGMLAAAGASVEDLEQLSRMPDEDDSVIGMLLADDVHGPRLKKLSRDIMYVAINALRMAEMYDETTSEQLKRMAPMLSMSAQEFDKLDQFTEAEYTLRVRRIQLLFPYGRPYADNADVPEAMSPTNGPSEERRSSKASGLGNQDPFWRYYGVKWFLKTAYGFHDVPCDEDHLVFAKACLAVASGDGELHPDEKSFLMGYLAAHGHPHSVLSTIESSKGDDDLEQLLTTESSEAVNDRKREMIFVAIQVAGAEGEYAEEEKEAVRHLANLLEVDESMMLGIECLVEEEEVFRSRRLEYLFPDGAPF